MKPFKFRAECMFDVTRFLTKFEPLINKAIIQPAGIDVEVTLYTTASIMDILYAMDELVDTHVMQETLQPLKYYTGKRTYKPINLNR